MVDPKEFSLMREEFEASGGTWDFADNAWRWVDDHGRFHREGDLPAYIARSVKQWVIHGERHRDHGPAYVEYQGTTVVYTRWYFRGKTHRLDGPAVDWDGRLRYFVNDVEFKDGDTDEYREACRRFRIEHGLLEPGKLTKPARAHT